jgi:hypothetical protein
VHAARLTNVLPGSVSRAIAKLNSGSIRLHDSISLKDYPRPDTTASWRVVQ